MPNLFDRGKGLASAQSPSLQALLALKTGLQASAIACDAFHREIQSISGNNVIVACIMYHLCQPVVTLGIHTVWSAEADQHKNTDVLLLVLLHSLDNSWRKNAESLVKKKFASGLFDGSSVTRVIKGHQVWSSDLKHVQNGSAISLLFLNCLVKAFHLLRLT